MSYSTSGCKSPISYALSHQFTFHKDVKPFTRGVFLALCGYANNQSKTAFPSQARLADLFKVSVRHIQRALKELLDFGYIYQVSRKAKLVAVYAISMSQKYLGRDDKIVELKSGSHKRKKPDNPASDVLIRQKTTTTPVSHNHDTSVVEKRKEEEGSFSKTPSISPLVKDEPCPSAQQESRPAAPITGGDMPHRGAKYDEVLFASAYEEFIAAQGPLSDEDEKALLQLKQMSCAPRALLRATRERISLTELMNG